MRLDDMISALQERRALPDLSVAITFDDGYESIFDNAFPLLQEFGFPFALFLSTGPIDRQQQGYMSWDQVVQLSEAGVLIANHMVEHPYMLDREPGEEESEWLQRNRQELLTAERRIQEYTGQNHRYLAYPYGEYNSTLKAMLAAEGFVGLAQNSGATGFESDFLALPRFPLASIYANLDTARTKFTSLAFDVQQLQPESPVTSESRPSSILKFEPGAYNFSQIGCFANSQALGLDWSNEEESKLTITVDMDFTGRRWRYICTAPLPGSDRFYWYSVQWIDPEVN